MTPAGIVGPWSYIERGSHTVDQVWLRASLTTRSIVETRSVQKREGGEGTRLWLDSLDGTPRAGGDRRIELHPWNCTVDDIEHPDVLIFDLDPGEGVEWSFVRETALRLREMLKSEGHEGTWPKLTGGKGVHVMVPLQRRSRGVSLSGGSRPDAFHMR
jgi:DNA primase